MIVSAATIIALVLVVGMLSAALAVLLLRNAIAAVAAASVVSLAVALVFVLLRAPDVAMTEAAVGAGLSGLILALGLRRLGLWRVDGPRSSESALQPTRKESGDA